jgi:hypothetical protein
LVTNLGCEGVNRRGARDTRNLLLKARRSNRAFW